METIALNSLQRLLRLGHKNRSALKPAFAQIGKGLISLIEWITDSLGNYMAVFIPPRLGITPPQ